MIGERVKHGRVHLGGVGVHLSYDSPEDLVADMRHPDAMTAARRRVMYHGIEWYGLTYRDAQAALCGSDPLDAAGKVAEAAEKAIDLPETLSAVRGLDVVGAAPCVGAYLAGRPDCMVRMSAVPALGPVRVWWDMTSSESYGTGALAERAAPILAAIHAHAAYRPIELWAVVAIRPNDCGALVLSCRMPSVPWCLSTVAAPFVCGGIGRHLYAAGTMLAFGGVVHCAGFLTNGLREVLGCAPDDILIPAASAYNVGLDVDAALRAAAITAMEA